MESYDIDYVIDNNSDNYGLSEFEQDDHPPILRGRLKRHLPYWASIDASGFALDVIDSGYRLPFIETPSKAYFDNNQSALTHSDFVESAILELIKTHAITEVPSIPKVVNPLSVSVNSSGKKRLILDLR